MFGFTVNVGVGNNKLLFTASNILSGGLTTQAIQIKIPKN